MPLEIVGGCETSVFVHDNTGKVKSFGILAETRRFRGGMRPSDGTVVTTADVSTGDVEKFRTTRGHIAANLAIVKCSALFIGTKNETSFDPCLSYSPNSNRLC